MKKLLIFIGTIFISTFAIAHTIEWYVGDSLLSTTTCSSGDSITPPTAPAKYGYTFDKWDLPYKKLEYIEATGTQWIDTGFYANGGMILDAKVLPINSSIYIGSITDNYDQTRNLIEYANGNYRPQKRNHYSTNYSEAGISPAVIHLDTTGTKLYCTVNGNTAVNVTVTELDTQTVTVKLGRLDYGSTIVSGRYYYVKIAAADGVLVRNFIPAKRISDNAIGMYDTVTNTFFENAGTGTFIAGPEVGVL